MLDGTEELPGLAVDTEFRWTVVGALAVHGADDGGALIEAELEHDPTDIGQRRAAARRASRPTAEAKAGAWAAVHGGQLNLAMERAILGGFGPVGQEDLVRPYVAPYFAELHQLWNERSREEALDLIDGLFPHALIEQETVVAADRALADAELPGPVRRILLEGKDAVERALRARAADRPA